MDHESLASDELLSWFLINSDNFEAGQNSTFTFDDPEPFGGIADLFSHHNEQNTMQIPSNDGSFVVSSVQLHTSSSSTSSSTLHTFASYENLDESSRKQTSPVNNSGPAKKRQRETVDDLEKKVQMLQAENAELHAHVMNVTQRTTEVQKQRTQMERYMADKVATINDDSEDLELTALVKKYRDIYADYGNCRQKEVAFHLNHLEKLVMPTQATKMCLWMLQQDKQFFECKTSPLYGLLTKELDITPDQTCRVQERRQRIRLLLDQLRESLKLISDLRNAIECKHACFDAQCGQVERVSTPKQTVKFLLWISRNADKLVKYVPNFTRAPASESPDGFSRESECSQYTSSSSAASSLQGRHS